MDISATGRPVHSMFGSRVVFSGTADLMALFPFRHGFVWRITSRRTKFSPTSGRGLGHVTPTIFGSTVGYPSDSLASCY